MKITPPHQDLPRKGEPWGFGAVIGGDEDSLEGSLDLASLIGGVPIAVISLAGEPRCRVKSRIALDMELILGAVEMVSRLSNHSGLLVVPDMRLDDRFAQEPWVTGEPGIRFYAGITLMSSGGESIGNLCVMDTVRRDFSEAELIGLRSLGRQVVVQIEQQRKIEELNREKASLLDTIKDQAESEKSIRASERKRTGEERDRLFNYSLDLLCVANFEGRLEQVNPAWTQCLGWTAEELTSRPMNTFIHPDDLEATRRTRATIVEGYPMRGFENRYRCRDGSYRWLSWNVYPLHGDRKVFAVARDVSEQKLAEAKIHRLNRLYAVSSGINEAIVRIRDTGELYEQACRIAVERGGLVMAWVGLAGPEEEVFLPVAHWGRNEGYLELVQVSTNPNLLTGKGPGGSAFRTGLPACSNDLETDLDSFASRNEALDRGYRSCAAFPLKLEGLPIGILAVYSDQPGSFGEEELQLLNALAKNLSFAVESQQREEHRLRAEAALRASEATMAEAQRIGHFGSWELEFRDPADTGVHPQRWSDEMYRVAGFEPGSTQITHELLNRLIHPDDLESVRAAFHTAVRERRQYSIVHRLVRPDGEERIVHETARIFFDKESGQPRKMVGNTHDITEQRRAEQTLRESEQRFRQIAENIHEVFWITDPATGQTLYVSPAYETVWGRTCKSLYDSPRSWLNDIHPEDRERVKQAAETTRERGEYDEIYRIIHADGETRWIHDRGYPVRNEQGDFYRMVGTAEDITERRQAEEKLRQQATLLDKARDAIIVRDLDHHILFWNRGAERLYGWTSEQAVGQSIKDLVYLDPTRFLAATETTLATGEWLGEIEQSTQDGRTVIIEGRWTLVRDDHGRPRSILAINTDITQRKELEKQFLRAQRMESIGTLAGGIAHDLNNVLAPILMSIDLLKLQASDPRTLEILAVIGSSARRGADMVSQVLSFAGGMDGRRVSVDLRQLIADFVKIIGETFPKNIRIETILGFDLWALDADPTQLHQVLLNLCVNSRDAMPDGGRISIRVENRMLDEADTAMHQGTVDGPHLCIEVEDTGDGIPSAVIDSIFDPFFTTKEIGKGTGLGLSTAMAIVKAHSGSIRVHSAPGTGTRFLILLPATGLSHPETTREVPREFPRGEGQTVLVVDDDASIRHVTCKTLETFGYRALTACDGAEAVTVFAENGSRIDVVLTDMMMPVMDGPSLVRILKRLDRGIPIIGASGIAAGSLVTQSMEAGVKHFLPKPYQTEVLLETLRTILAEKAAAVDPPL